MQVSIRPYKSNGKSTRACPGQTSSAIRCQRWIDEEGIATMLDRAIDATRHINLIQARSA